MPRSDDYARDQGLSEVDREIDLEATILAMATNTSETDHNPPQPGPECDWGWCDEPAVAFRSDPRFGYLPVCQAHLGPSPVYACLVCCAEPCICHLPEDERNQVFTDALAKLMRGTS